MKNKSFEVTIYRESGEFVSSIIVNSFDRVDKIPVTSLSLAEKYTKKYILKEDQYCIAHYI